MSIITPALWQGQDLKFTLYIDDENTYEATTIGDTSNKFIHSISFNKSEGNTSVNPLGIASSDRVNISVFDPEDLLSPANTSGPYVDKLTTGLKIEVNISDDMGETWKPFGVFYTTSFSGNYSDGVHNLVTISGEDRLNTFGNTIVPELPVYANVSIQKIIESLYEALGYTTAEYYIDPLINTEYLWGILPGTKVRDFINSACQRMFARVLIDTNGVMRWLPALTLGTNYNQITVNPNMIGNLKNNTANNINYSRINVKYVIYGQETEATIYSNNNISLKVGENTIDNITFNNVVVAVTRLLVNYKSELGLGSITNVSYVAFGNGMIINIETEGESVYGVSITAEGIVMSTLSKIASLEVDSGGRVGLTEFTYENKFPMTEAEANQLCQDLWNYIKTLRNRITISNTALSPYISIGDKVTVEGTGTLYDGVYKVINIDLKFAETYSSSLTLLRLGEQ